jgi:hypothetical protein
MKKYGEALRRDLTGASAGQTSAVQTKAGRKVIRKKSKNLFAGLATSCRLFAKMKEIPQQRYFDGRITRGTS